MEKIGIETSIVSISAPGVYFGNEYYAIDLSRQCNEFSAQIIDKFPNKFGSFAVLPLPNIEASINEVKYALDILKLDGVGLLSNINDMYLGDPVFDPIFSELNRRKSVVFVHPNTSPTSPKTKVPQAIMEFMFNTTRAIANLIYNRRLKKYSDIKFIFPHAGGTAPYLAWRISMGEKRILKSLKNLYYDVALTSVPFALRSLQELVDPSHILFGSDFPFFPEPLITTMIERLENYDGFEIEEKRAIERDNALSLFPRLQPIK